MSRWREWTEKDELYLAEKYGTVPDEKLARRLKRGVGAMRQRAAVLGRTRTQSFHTANGCAHILGVTVSTLLGWIRKGYIQGERSTVVAAGPRMVWRIEPDELVRFIQEHPEIYDYRRIDPEEYRYWRRLANNVVVKESAPRLTRCWSPDEDAFIMNHHGRLTYREMGARLRRTKEAVHQRLRTLRTQGRLIPYKGYWRSKRAHDRLTPADYDDWSGADDRYLRENWGRPRRPEDPGVGKQNRRYKYITCGEIARELGKTKDACYSRAYRLEITRGRGFRTDPTASCGVAA